MKYLEKSERSTVVANEWSYPRDARRIRGALFKERMGFYAYSERYVHRTGAVDVEHFDPRLKATALDNYWNWYAVLHWMNQHKTQNIEQFEPMIEPYATSLAERIMYEDRQFLPVDPSDQEAANLIRYLGWNRPDLVQDRHRHVKRIRAVQQFCCDDRERFFEHLVSNPDNLSFFTALSAELGLPQSLLERFEPS